MALHAKIPVLPHRFFGNTGHVPSSSFTGLPAVQAHLYMSQWTQHNQLFSYSGPPDERRNDSIDYPGAFVVILHDPVKTDDDNDFRHLHGVHVPWYQWAVEPELKIGWDNDIKLTWTQPGTAINVDLLDTHINGGYYDDIHAGGSVGYDYTLRHRMSLHHQLTHGNDFVFEPHVAGLWTYGILITTGICTASLGIWSGPDPELTAAQAQIERSEVQPGDTIRGYDSSDNQQSLGHLINITGSSSKQADHLDNVARRCLFQTGHPRGIWTDSAALVDISTAGTHKVIPRNLQGLAPGTDINSYPAFFATTTGLANGAIAQVKYTSITSGDTWIVNITTNQSALYTFADATPANDKLEIDAVVDTFKVEIGANVNAADAGPEITLNSWSLWEDESW